MQPTRTDTLDPITLYRMIHTAMMLINTTNFCLTKVFPFGCTSAICNLFPSRPLCYGCLMYKFLLAMTIEFSAVI